MQINLIVIKTAKLHELAEFYTSLGFKFDYHQHQQGILHYSATINGLVFEIYPLPKKILEADTTMRLGLEVKNLDSLIGELRAKNINIMCEPMMNEFGKVAIIEDLDGRKIELLEKGV